MAGARAADVQFTRARFARAGFAALLLALTASARADIDRETLARIKSATVFVSLGLRDDAGSGSGFLVRREGERGLVVTNAHVAAGAAPGDLRVVFASGTRRADARPASVLAVSRARDLAVLEVTGPSLPAPLAISGDATAYETQTVHIVGFPFGKGFATNRETPVVTISRGTVSSQRLDVNDQARLMQIDGDLNPGNSGGPIVDDSGQVVGVAVATVRQTNIGFAIPLAPLVRMLAGTLTDLEAERTATGVRVRARPVDPSGALRSARLRVRALDEDRVLDLLRPGGRWASIAPAEDGIPFRPGKGDTWEAEHGLPPATAAQSLVGQITVVSAHGEHHLPPFRIAPRALAIALSGPDVRPRDEEREAGSPPADGGGLSSAGTAPAPSELDALLARAGIDGTIAALASRGDGAFDEAPASEEERTVKDRLDGIIADSWDEGRIRRVYLRSFEADPNADAERRALALLSLPAMKLLHLTLDRLLTVDPADVAALAKRRRGDPGAFEPRLALMRGIDERRGFSQTFETAFAIANGALARLVNDIRPPQRRMSPQMLDRDLSRAAARAGGESRQGVPLMLMHLYADAATQDLEDYLDQLDSAAMRWLAGRERAALSAVLTTQFAEAEEEIVALFRKVRREALGVDAPPDVAGLGTREALQALIDAHGKPPIIAFVLARRGGEITVAGPRGIASRFGRPPVDAVDARTLAADLEALGLDAQAFAAALQQHLVDKAYRDRRLTARAERSRLIAALRAPRRAQLRAAEERARRAPPQPAGDATAVSQ